MSDSADVLRRLEASIHKALRKADGEEEFHRGLRAAYSHVLANIHTLRAAKPFDTTGDETGRDVA